MTGSTIELGVLPPAGAAEAEAPAPAETLGWVKRSRRWAAGALGVVVLLTATASAAPRPPWAVPHFTVPASADASGWFTLTEDVLYVVDWTPVENEATLRAYRLADGTLLWEATADEANLWEDHATLGWHGARGELVRSAWLDPETGEPLWQGQGYFDAAVGDWLVVSHWVPAPPDADLRWRAASLAILDRPTGSEVWRLPLVNEWAYAAAGSGREDRLVAIEDGWLSSYDLATGTQLATVEVPLTMPSWPRVYGGVVLIQREQTDPSLLAYDLDTLSPLWTLDGDGEILWDLGSCAGLLCVHTDFGTVAAVDLTTGEEVWSRQWPRDSTLDTGWREGHIVVGARGGTDQRVVDASTGAVVFELGEWQPRHDGGPELGQLVTRYDSPGQPLTVYGGRTWFARLHLDPPRLEVLGAVESGGDWCTTTTRYIACEDSDMVRVWRMGAAP